jgi:hypothetical protein
LGVSRRWKRQRERRTGIRNESRNRTRNWGLARMGRKLKRGFRKRDREWGGNICGGRDCRHIFFQGVLKLQNRLNNKVDSIRYRQVEGIMKYRVMHCP